MTTSPQPTVSIAKTTNIDTEGFAKALFDMNFDHFVTLKFTKVIYLVLLALTVINLLVGWIIPSIFFISQGEVALLLGILWLLIGWVFPLVSLILSRVVLEFFISTIRTAQNTTHLLEQSGK